MPAGAAHGRPESRTAGRPHLGHIGTALELFLRLRHLASSSETAAETALKTVKDARTRTPSSHPRRPPASFEARATIGSAPTSTPLTAPQALTRARDSSSNLRWPVAIPSAAQKTRPQRKPGYPPNRHPHLIDELVRIHDQPHQHANQRPWRSPCQTHHDSTEDALQPLRHRCLHVFADSPPAVL